MTETLDLLPPVPTFEQIDRLEKAMLARPDRTEIEPRHYFAEGIYVREITIPAGVPLIGKIHKTSHINIVSRGEIIVWTETGMKRLSAPFTFVSQPGTKRVGWAVTDTVWSTIHPNLDDTHDLALLESQLIWTTEEYLLERAKAPAISTTNERIQS
jgi:hypothetical protein